MDLENKRLFFGMDALAPWPEHLPQGRILDPQHRHLTLAFLGQTEISKMESALPHFPIPKFKVGFVGKFDQCLFFPKKRPRVAAWHVEFLEETSPVSLFQKELIRWLKEKGFSTDEHHNFNPHVTIARAPFNERVWQNKFAPLPLVLKDIHLYESVGGLKYEPIWSYPLISPFEEIEHTADIAFWIRGETFDQLYEHAQVALAFKFPEILPYLKKNGVDSLDDVIIELNHRVSDVDQEIGCPFKAVSFHTHLVKEDELMHWEMIIDV